MSLNLSSIGCRTRELFDFVELYARTGEPSPTTVLLMAAARRDFFLTIQHGKFYQGKPVIGYDLPGVGDELSGLPYLPVSYTHLRANISRLLAKLEETGAMKYSIVVAASASDPAAMLYLACLLYTSRCV